MISHFFRHPNFHALVIILLVGNPLPASSMEKCPENCPMCEQVAERAARDNKAIESASNNASNEISRASSGECTAGNCINALDPNRLAQSLGLGVAALAAAKKAEAEKLQEELQNQIQQRIANGELSRTAIGKINGYANGSVRDGASSIGDLKTKDAALAVAGNKDQISLLEETERKYRGDAANAALLNSAISGRIQRNGLDKSLSGTPSSELAKSAKSRAAGPTPLQNNKINSTVTGRIRSEELPEASRKKGEREILSAANTPEIIKPEDSSKALSDEPELHSKVKKLIDPQDLLLSSEKQKISAIDPANVAEQIELDEIDKKYAAEATAGHSIGEAIAAASEEKRRNERYLKDSFSREFGPLVVPIANQELEISKMIEPDSKRLAPKGMAKGTELAPSAGDSRRNEQAQNEAKTKAISYSIEIHASEVDLFQVIHRHYQASDFYRHVSRQASERGPKIARDANPPTRAKGKGARPAKTN